MTNDLVWIIYNKNGALQYMFILSYFIILSKLSFMMLQWNWIVKVVTEFCTSEFYL